jgi:hypothetical protein
MAGNFPRVSKARRRNFFYVGESEIIYGPPELYGDGVTVTRVEPLSEEQRHRPLGAVNLEQDAPTGRWYVPR